MRIVTGGAYQLPPALLKACGSPQSVGRTRDLKFVIEPGARRVIVEEHIVPERLARPVGKAAFFKSWNGMRQVEAGGLQMTLHAYLELPIQGQACGIDDVRFSCGPHVFAARTVASLAIDALRDAIRLPLRVCVVTEDAVVGDGPAKAHVIGAVVAGVHRPTASPFRVPRQ